MLIKSERRSDLSENQITPEHVFKDRRRLLKSLGFGMGAATLGVHANAQGLLDGLFGNDDDPEPAGQFKTKPLEFKNLQSDKPERPTTPFDQRLIHLLRALVQG